jgi:hypothetical protein
MILFGGKAGNAGLECGNAAASFSRKSWNSEYLPQHDEQSQIINLCRLTSFG